MATIYDVSDSAALEVIGLIERAAYGRIRGLNVRQDQGHIVLEGFARCFHDKQRAQEAAFSAAQCIGPIANRIQVDH